jgi:hypothetical protein
VAANQQHARSLQIIDDRGLHDLPVVFLRA